MKYSGIGGQAVIEGIMMMNRNDFEEITDQGDGISAITQRQINILDEMPEDMEQACVEVLRTAAERIGGEMVRAAAEYLAVSRHGLREQDLECLAQERKIPWNSLDFSLFFIPIADFFANTPLRPFSFFISGCQTSSDKEKKQVRRPLAVK